MDNDKDKEKDNDKSKDNDKDKVKDNDKSKEEDKDQSGSSFPIKFESFQTLQILVDFCQIKNYFKYEIIKQPTRSSIPRKILFTFSRRHSSENGQKQMEDSVQRR